MIEQLTRNLESMIYHQRQAKALPDKTSFHHDEARRYRLEADRLSRQQRVIRQLIGIWLNEN